MNSIFHRVSVRKFKDDPVKSVDIEWMMRAAMAAPSACNQQPWEFYVVTDSETLLALSQVHKYSGMVKDAPAAIVSAYRTNSYAAPFAQVDMAIAMENLWLETDAQGLGGVWLGVAPIEEHMCKVEQIIGMSDTLRAFAIFPFGYPAEERPQQNRFDPARIHWFTKE